MTKRVAIIGAAHRFPGTTPERFWQDLQDERDLVTQVAEDRWSHDSFLHANKRHPGTSITFAAGSLGDIDGFDAAFFGISPREAAHMDPQQRMLLELAWEAMEDAGLKPSSLRGSRCGVFVGIASLDHSFRMADDLEAIDASTATGNASSIASNRLSYLFDLHGPSMSLDTACSSSLVAFHQACQAIRSGETDTALTGGISLHLHPYGFLVFSKASMLSPNGRCRVFDADGDGYVRSEGAGLFMLKDLDKALEDGDRILAVVAGSAVNTDGHKSGLTVPNPEAQIALMREAYDKAGITPDDIDYLEAHGTGTAVGDPIETRAIGQALGTRRSTPLPIGSVKSNLGHLETASGAAGLAKALYSLRHREVPATIGLKTPNPRIDLDGWNLDIVTRARPLKPEGRLVIGINSFGFGGANAHVILESPPEAAPAPAPSVDAALPLRLSAKSAPALKAMAGRLAEWLREREDDDFYDIAYTLQHRRERHPEGALLFARDRQEAARILAAYADADDTSELALGQHIESASGPVFVYSGNGCQWETMGRDLLEHSPRFAAAVDEVDALFQQHGDFSLRAELEGRNGQERFQRTEIAQPALFAVQVGITELLREQGIDATAVTGHSVGEVAAAWACGALSLADAVKVIHRRSHFQGQTRGLGEMTAVGLGEADLSAWLELPEFADLVIAGINSPKGATLAGPPDSLGRLEARLAAEGVFAKRLPLDYAFHSPAMDGIEQGLIDALQGLAPSAGTIPFVSTVTGTTLTGTSLDPTYWWRNIREPVLFGNAVGELVEQGHNTFIEIGAHPILRRYLNEILRDKDRQGLVIDTLDRQRPGEQCLRDAAGKTLLSGASTALDRHFPVEGRLADLPRYPWQRERHWVQGTTDGQGLLSRHYEHPLLGYRLAQQSQTWESQLDTGRLPWLADHVVGEGAVFPGAGFLELALAAARHERDSELIDIEELEIQAPLLLDGANGRRTRTCLAPDSGHIEVLSREPVTGQEWQRHAVARVMQQSRGFQLRRQPPTLPERAPDFRLADHLAMAEAIGLHYGPAFQAIGHGWVEGDSVIGEVSLPEVIERELDHSYLHPGILDSAFQLFIPLLAQEGLTDEGLAFVPVRVGRLQWRADGARPALAHARLLKRAPHSFTADFELFDAEGQAVAVLSETRFKAIRLKPRQTPHLSHLGVCLTPAPRRPAAPDLSPLYAAMPQLVEAFTGEATRPYAQEVDPLLDGLAEAFAERALRDACRDGVLTRADYRALVATHLNARPLVDQLLRLLVDAGRLAEDEQGWTFTDDEQDAITPEQIWRLLQRDYPEHFAPLQRLGRFGRHLPALLEGQARADDVGLEADALTALTASLVGEQGWRAIADTLLDCLPTVLTVLPDGQRLSVLEAGPTAPLLGECLTELFDPDHCDYRAMTVGDAAHQHASRLQERFPTIAVEALDPHGDDAPSRRLPPAQLALVSLDVTHAAEVERLLNAVVGRLAPGAELLLVGIRPSAWLDTLLATPGLDDDAGPRRATEPDAVIDQLKRLGASDVQHLSPQDEERGAYLLHARLAESPQLGEESLQLQEESPQLQEKSPQLPNTGADILLVADAEGRRLADQLAEGLAQRGATATITDAPPSPEAASPQRIVDLRRGEARCEQAADWAKAFDDAQNVSLWLVTRGVAGMWVSGEASGVSGEWSAESHEQVPGPDAALWGFGRSLANEAQGFTLTLLDLPAGDPADGRVEIGEPLLAALVDELLAPDTETEIVLNEDGQRYATRLRPLPAPGAHQDDNQRQAMTLGFDLPGQLRHLRWKGHELPAPQAGEVEIRVKATGLNFRDVMYTLGLLSDEAIENGFAGPTLGLEFSGIVEAVGPDVANVAVGDTVVGFGPASFSDRLIARHNAIAPLPEGIGFAAAATIPTTFFTVYYALKHLARLAPGERVLIHGAAGGVGIAALQVAQWLGAEILATAGSDEKRDFLRLMGVERIYDSRALTFAEEILEETQGQGVDVVLNSLAGEAIHQNLRVLRPFGRFLELGKRDFYENTPIGLRPFRNNLSYFGIDSDQLMKELPELTGELFGEMMGHFRDGTFTPLPYTAFDNHQVIEAFRYMQQARQIGKVVVTHERSPGDAPHVSAESPLALSADASYLVTGGLGGFGLRTAEWLAERGARHLILLGRSGPASEEARAGVAALEASGVTVWAEACDVTDRDALAALLSRAKAELPPLRGVVHAATVIDDGLIRNLDAERIQRVLAPKIDGARHLDDLTRELALDFFVLYSSATTLFGNPGQASYVASNHWLEALASHRRALGLPATCVCWGAIDDVGFLARNTQTRDALQERLGGNALPSAMALAELERLLVHGGETRGILELDWSALSRFLPTAQAPRFLEIARHGEDDGRHDQDDSLLKALAELPPEAMHEAIVDLLRAELAGILLIEEDKIDPQRSVYEMGFDSLMGVELMTAIESRLGVQVPVMVLSEASTLDKLAGVLINKLTQSGDASAEDDTQDINIETLAERHGAKEVASS
ncbi:type I polyketide synthase [Halomonas sp. THAF12]|uniref:type I polyketide synthase n=1 Tax=Halomonas sp. B23F22_10 TaxID=3459515 RepID=UPI00373E3354